MNKLNTLLNLNEKAIRNGIIFIDEERRNGYKNTAHIMRFPRSEGFNNELETHEGLIFPLAIIVYNYIQIIIK